MKIRDALLLNATPLRARSGHASQDLQAWTIRGSISAIETALPRGGILWSKKSFIFRQPLRGTGISEAIYAGSALALLIAVGAGLFTMTRQSWPGAESPPLTATLTAVLSLPSPEIPVRAPQVEQEPNAPEETIAAVIPETQPTEARPPATIDTHAAAPARASPGEIGVYLTASSVANRSFLEQTIAAVKKSGGTALVIDVKDTYVLFESTSPLATELHLLRPKYDLAEVVRLAEENGLEVIARFVVVKDPGLARAAPETQIRNPQTGQSVGAVWIDPGHPTVLAYNAEVLREVIAAGVREVNFDYIRYPTEYTLEQVGLPLEEKIARVEGFLRMARETRDAMGADTRLGISTYAILGWDEERNIGRLAQDVARFAPLVDVISPMVYPASFGAGFQKPKEEPGSRMYYLVKKTLEGYRAMLGEGKSRKLRPWIQGYRATSWDMGEQIRAVHDAGLCGFTVWSPSNTYGSLYQALPQYPRSNACGASSP